MQRFNPYWVFFELCYTGYTLASDDTMQVPINTKLASDDIMQVPINTKFTVNVNLVLIGTCMMSSLASQCSKVPEEDPVWVELAVWSFVCVVH